MNFKKTLFAALASALCLSNIFTTTAFAAPSNNWSEDPAVRASIPIESNTITGWPEGPTVNAESAIVMEASTGTILYEKNTHEELYPASITKILTTLVALEHSEMNESVTFSHNSVFDIEADSSKIGGVEEGDQLTMEQCLYGIMLCSGAEASYAVAEHVGGDLAGFVELMNQKVKELGCLNTNFTNPHGLHNENHYTTTYDMALIAKAAWANPDFQILAGTTLYEFPPTTRTGEQRLRSTTNKMAPGGKYAYDGWIGGKTGYTTHSKATLVTYAERDGITLICVVMREDGTDHWDDTCKLLDYGFNNFQKVNIYENEKNFTIDNANFFKTNSNVFGNTNALVQMNKSGNIIIPKSAAFTDATPTLTFDSTSADVVAKLSYVFNDHFVGYTTIDLTNTSGNSFDFNLLTSEQTGQGGTTTSDDSISADSSDNSSDSSSTTAVKQKTFIPINLKIVFFLILGIMVILLLIRIIRVLITNYYFGGKHPLIRKKFLRRKSNRKSKKRSSTKNRHYLDL